MAGELMNTASLFFLLAYSVILNINYFLIRFKLLHQCQSGTCSTITSATATTLPQMGTPCLTSAIHSHKNTFTKENKYTILVHLTVFDHLCPVGAHLDLSGHFQTKVDLWLGSYRQKSMVWTEKNDFLKEIHLKTAFSRRQKAASSHFGRTNY